jgi:hypothetical protein
MRRLMSRLISNRIALFLAMTRLGKVPEFSRQIQRGNVDEPETKRRAGVKAWQREERIGAKECV